jgi:FAD/FMN-containing dehydrogenase
MEMSGEDALNYLREVFEDRIRQRPIDRESDAEGHLSMVLPVSAEEVQVLSEVAERYSLPLIAQGALTDPDHQFEGKKGSILIRFDLMGRIRLPADHEEAWAEAEPGALWLEMDNYLHVRGRGLTVYPTSAPLTTIGGWLAMDGLGVGSFEYGWLRENVLSADVVLPGGERREVRGEEMHVLVGPTGAGGILVAARLRTRRADADVPFGVAFGGAEELAGWVAGVAEAGVPLWHLAFLNPEMARIRGLGEDYLLFGAYPRERAAEVEEGLRSTIEPHGRRVLGTAESYRVWGERFFPAVPRQPIPKATREFVSVAELRETLSDARDRPGGVAIQGTVARSREVLLLTFDPHEKGRGNPNHDIRLY